MRFLTLFLILLFGIAKADEPFGANLPKPVFTQMAQVTAPPPAPADDSRIYVGQATCLGCHQQEGNNWAHTIHAKVFNPHPRDAREEKNCEACHGPGSAHVDDPSDRTKIISFSHNSKTPIQEQNEQCLGCHKGGQRIFWHDSVHEQNKLACSDCHNPMSNFAGHGLTVKESVSET